MKQVVLIMLLMLLTASAASAKVSQRAHTALATGWTGFAYTPYCYPSVSMNASCQGFGIWYADEGEPAWNQIKVCGAQLMSGGWQLLSCRYNPPSPFFSDYNEAQTPPFRIAHCGRWYSTWVTGYVLLTGGWRSDSAVAPGIKVRCPS